VSASHIVLRGALTLAVFDDNNLLVL